MIDTPHNINVISRFMGPVHKRYLRVLVGVHNTAATGNLDSEPSRITLIGAEVNSIHPMDEAEVRNMAKEVARRKTLGVMGATLFLDISNSAANFHNQSMQVSQQMRTDEMSEAAFQKIGNDLASIQRTNLLRETVFPGTKLEGFVYFDLGKNGAVSGSYSGNSLNVPLGGLIYEMDFGETAGRYSAPPAGQASTAVAQPAPVAQPIALTVAPADPHVLTSTIKANLQITSQHDGVGIELDGNFVGNTPPLIKLLAGDHTIRLSREGLVIWEKKIHITEGDVTINAIMNSKPMVYRAR